MSGQRNTSCACYLCDFANVRLAVTVYVDAASPRGKVFVMQEDTCKLQVSINPDNLFNILLDQLCR